MINNNISNLEDHLGYWLRCLSNFVHKNFEKRLEHYNISVAQWVVLRSLYARKDITLNEAANIIGVDKSSLSRMIERLVHKKLVNRRVAKDRRSIYLSLAKKGNLLVPKLAKKADENDEIFFNKISKGKKEEMINIIKQLLDLNGWNSIAKGHDKFN